MVIAICSEVVLQIQTFEVLHRIICFLTAGFDLLHHAMHDRGLPTTAARHDYRAAIACAVGRVYVKIQLEIVIRVLQAC
jgi:short subunit fatty acids transporter